MLRSYRKTFSTVSPSTLFTKFPFISKYTPTSSLLDSQLSSVLNYIIESDNAINDLTSSIKLSKLNKKALFPILLYPKVPFKLVKAWTESFFSNFSYYFLEISKHRDFLNILLKFINYHSTQSEKLKPFLRQIEFCILEIFEKNREDVEVLSKIIEIRLLLHTLKLRTQVDLLDCILSGIDTHVIVSDDKLFISYLTFVERNYKFSFRNLSIYRKQISRLLHLYFFLFKFHFKQKPRQIPQLLSYFVWQNTCYIHSSRTPFAASRQFKGKATKFTTRNATFKQPHDWFGFGRRRLLRGN